MGKASRAIIIDGDKILVMKRVKYGSEYYTLVGGRVNEGEAEDQAVVREVKEETGLVVTSQRLVFIEDNPAPYNTQFIYLCEVAPHDDIAIEDASEEALLNRLGANIHQPLWAGISAFERLPFRTPQLQKAISDGLKKGFPKNPIQL